MNRGYTVVWSGWQGDLGARANWKTISVPVVPDITGLSREEFIFDHTRNPAVATLTYPAADLDPAKARLTVRQRETDPRTTPPDLSFTFDGADKVSIKRPEGFDAGAIYELIYQAKDPKVMGMGFAATRDIVSFLRRESADVTGAANPVAGRIDYAVSLGVSQSGRFLHDFLYLGFNEDENGRVVFDGLMPHPSAGKKMFTNYRFAQPGRNMQEHGETLYPGTAFPFTYPVTTDTVTGRTDGWLARCLAAKNCPKIMQTDTDLEFYQSFGSLVVTDAKGEPLTMPDNVRLYYLASLQHSSTATAKSGMNPLCTYPTNPLYAGPVLRALLVALEGWTSDGTAPPASRYPSRADGTLVTPVANAAGFPNVPGFRYGGLVHQPTVVDHDAMPPAKKTAYPLFVPRIDADGNAVAGIRLPTLVAPVATHLGWNVRKAGFGDGALCGNFGSMLPFARTREERIKANDPRLSIEERYPNAAARAAIIEQAARQLVHDRLLLEDDVRSYLQATN
jgi:Alpha/beta hydrolase domain